MILTATLNPAIDITYRVPELVPGAIHRASRAGTRLGGKGLNVAAVLAQLGTPVRATGLLKDGPDGFWPIAEPVRQTIVITDGRAATGLWEPGPAVTPQEWAGFKAHFAGLVRDSAVAVLAGSLPQGLPCSAYAELVEIARAAGARTILDTSGEALAMGLTAGPDIAKPNLDELAELLQSAGPAWSEDRTTIVVSSGANGLTARSLRARPPYRIDGNPTGAGDACVAALARGLLHGTPWPELLRDAAALSAAAVAAPVAGMVDVDLYQQLLPAILVEEV